MFGDLISLLTIENLTDAIGAFLAVPVVTVLPLGVLAILLVEFVFRRLRGLLGVHHAASEASEVHDIYDEVAAFASYAALKASGYRADDIGAAYQLNEEYYVGRGGEIFLTYSDAAESYIPASDVEVEASYNRMRARVHANNRGQNQYYDDLAFEGAV